MSRTEFPKPVLREALRRSGMLCEAVGPLYGLKPDQRCSRPLSKGVRFDHAIADGIGGKPTLENCAAVCPLCHAFKTAKHDIPRIAKTKRQSDKALGIRSTSRPMDGSKRSAWRKPFNGPAVRRHQ